MKRIAFPLVSLPMLLVCLAGAASAQLQPDQKMTDFQTLVALFNKQYAPYDWKKEVIGFDMLNISPWLAKVKATTDDLGFYEVCAAYVASLKDMHSAFFVDSDFTADLGFSADLYDGKALIDTISTPVSRAASMKIGDELVSVDGKAVADWLTEFALYSALPNQRSTDRANTTQITFRSQEVYPRAAAIGDTASVVVRHQSTGAMETYTLPWTTAGMAITSNGPVSSPTVNAPSSVGAKLKRAIFRGIRGNRPPSPGGVSLPPRSKALMSLRNYVIPNGKELRGLDLVTPVFQPAFPSSFVRRLGRSGDYFYSGSYTSGGKKIGYIRIADFLDPTDPEDEFFAQQEFESEIAFFQKNTDGLVVDVMSNPGGDGCYAEALAQELIPYRFRGIGQQIRVTQDFILGVSQEIDQAPELGYDQTTVDQLNAILVELQAAYQQNRGLTVDIPLCNTYYERDPATDAKGSSIAYTKPILLLTDEFTMSAAEIFSAEFQDSQRGPLLGWRSAGGGGDRTDAQESGFYSESYATVTVALLLRTQNIVTPDFPTTSYIENVGVRPDIVVDYMTADNLTNHGASFVDAFTTAMLNLLQ